MLFSRPLPSGVPCIITLSKEFLLAPDIRSTMILLDMALLPEDAFPLESYERSGFLDFLLAPNHRFLQEEPGPSVRRREEESSRNSVIFLELCEERSKLTTLSLPYWAFLYFFLFLGLLKVLYISLELIELLRLAPSIMSSKPKTSTFISGWV